MKRANSDSVIDGSESGFTVWVLLTLTLVKVAVCLFLLYLKGF